MSITANRGSLQLASCLTVLEPAALDSSAGWPQYWCMDQDEYGILLRSLRERTRVSGRADLDTRLMNSRASDVPGPREAVIGYLRGLRDEMSLGGVVVVRESMRQLRTFPTESGEPIDGIVVNLEGADRQAFGVEEVDLVGSPELDDAVRQIDELISEIQRDLAQ